MKGYRLTFDKVSRDGSGKCDLEATGNPADRVWGVLFRIAANEADALDDFEGLGEGYCKSEVQAMAQRGVSAAVAYFATKKDVTRLSYHWYRALVMAGAVEHELPAVYVEAIEKVASVQDPDARRRAEKEAILCSS